MSGGTERIFAGSVRECSARVSTVVSLMRKTPPFVQCKVELESTAASLRHILISPGVGRGRGDSPGQAGGGTRGPDERKGWPGPRFGCW